jgi:hypothetical protein
MPNQTYRVRLAPQLAQQAQTLADMWELPLAAILRLAITDLLAHQERLPALLAARQEALDDTTTPEQRRAAEAYLQSLEGIDLSAVLGDHEPA